MPVEYQYRTALWKTSGWWFKASISVENISEAIILNCGGQEIFSVTLVLGRSGFADVRFLTFLLTKSYVSRNSSDPC